MYGCESWTVKKAELRIIDAFELWCWRRLLRVPWTVRRFKLNIIFRFSSLSGREMPWVQNCAFNQELTHITRMQNGHMCQSSAPRSISGSTDDSRNLQKNYSSFKSLLNVFMVVIARYGAERICFCCLFLFFRGQNHSYHSRKCVSHVCNYMSENP